MSSKVRYQPPKPQLWQGRLDTPENSCIFQLVQPLDLRHIQLPAFNEEAAFAILGFCCDEGIERNHGRVGAAEGPHVLREVIARLPIQRTDILIFDVGDVVCDDTNLEGAQHSLGEIIALLLQHNMTPIVLGGGHEISWGNYQGIASAFPNERLGIVNIDAHFDMRPLLPDDKGSSGTPFLQIARAHEASQRPFDYTCIGIQPAGNIKPFFETMRAYGGHVIMAEELQQGNTKNCAENIVRVIEQNQIIYLSVCLDAFSASYAPGVSAPQVLGITPWQVLPIIRQLADSGKVVSYDVAEYSPRYDQDLRTAKLAANLVYEIIHHHKNRK